MKRMRLAIQSIILTVLCGIASGFVFSCEEVKYHLVNLNLEESTRYVCLVPEPGYPLDQLKTIYAQEDKTSTSFTDLAAATCVERVGEGAWRIVADEPVNLDCTYEFSLIFTSVPYNTDMIVTAPSGGSTGGFGAGWNAAITVVSPRTGIKIQTTQCEGSGNVTVYTGAGSGVAEFRFAMQSWRCVDLPKWIVSFDNVITITTDSQALQAQYSTNDIYKDIVVNTTDRLAVLSSGRSDNLQNLRANENYVTFSAGADVVSSIDISSSFDVRYNGHISIAGDNSAWTKQYINESLHADLPTAKKIRVEYASNSVAAKDIWDSEDNFVVEFTLNTPPPPPQEAVKPAYCGCDTDPKFGTSIGWETTDVWVDLIIILDTSKAMGDQSLIRAKSLIKQFLGDDFTNVLTTDVSAKFYTRVGLIAMSDTADILYSLNMTKNDDFSGIQIKEGVNEIDVAAAFEKALTMFNTEMKPDRMNTRQVIYYMTDSDPKSNPSGINEFKNSQGTIIVNNFLAEGEVERPGLKNISSDGYYDTDLQTDYMKSVQLFCKANCYCLADKDEYKGLTVDPAIRAGGGCFVPVPTGFSWNMAKSTCAQMGAGGLLVSIHDDNKAQFCKQKLAAVAPKASYFWFGYSKSDDGSWKWEDKSKDPYTNWDANEPSPVAVSKCGYGDVTTSYIYWGAGNCNAGFPSVCEFPPCMAGNKC